MRNGMKKLLARASNTPVATQEINFFYSCRGAFTSSDLPGYGYCKCGPLPIVRKWQRLLKPVFIPSPDFAERAFVLI